MIIGVESSKLFDIELLLTDAMSLIPHVRSAVRDLEGAEYKLEKAAISKTAMRRIEKVVEAILRTRDEVNKVRLGVNSIFKASS